MSKPKCRVCGHWFIGNQKKTIFDELNYSICLGCAIGWTPAPTSEEK